MTLDLKFRKLGNHSLIPNLAEYAKDQMASHDDCKIYVGSDSQNNSNSTKLATVVVFHYGNNGAHVAYRTLSLPKMNDEFSRLWFEVTSSMEIAQYLKELGLKVSHVDLDLNEDEHFKSNAVLRSAVGYVESMGFSPRWKPHNADACRVADALCR